MSLLGDTDGGDETHSLAVTVPSKLNDPSGFPQSASANNASIQNNTYQALANDDQQQQQKQQGTKKKRQLSPKKTVQMINRYTFRLYNCFKVQIVVLLVAFGIELFWARWEIIAAIVCGFFSLIIGWYGAHQRSICCLQLFSVIETAGFLFSFFGTALIYWIIINYDDFCTSVATGNKNCIPKIVFLATAASAPVLFVLLLLGARYGYKLLRYHRYLRHAFTTRKGYNIANRNNKNPSMRENEALLLNDKNISNLNNQTNIVVTNNKIDNDDIVLSKNNGNNNGSNSNNNDNNGSNHSKDIKNDNLNKNDSQLYPDLRKNYHSNDNMTFKM